MWSKFISISIVVFFGNQGGYRNQMPTPPPPPGYGPEIYGPEILNVIIERNSQSAVTLSEFNFDKK